MNRRQFLGRFFQAVISAHNSNSIYGIYHPWRQYDTLTTTLYINLKYKSSDTYTSYIPSQSRSQTIIAVYDGNGAMIYCTAYYSGTTLRNYCDSTLYLYNMRPGMYTIKCLCYGIGLCEGENGNEMIITIPDIPDRSTLPNNNYGQMSAPTVNVDYLFGIAGIYFKAESELEDIGEYFYENQKLYAWKLTCKAPDYETCEAAYNQAAVDASLSSRYDRFIYMQDMTRADPPITDEYRYKIGNRCYIHSKIKAIYIDTNTENEIAVIDLKDYINSGASQAAEYWKVCEYNNLEYNPDADYENNSGLSWSIQISGITSTDGSYEVYMRMDRDGNCGVLNGYKDCNSVVAGGHANRWNGISSNNTEFNYEINEVNTLLTSETPIAVVNGQNYYGSPMMWINIQTVLNHDTWMYGDDPFHKEIVENGILWKDTPQEQYEANLPSVSTIRDTFYNTYWAPAFENYHVKPSNKIPWIKADISTHVYKYPVSALFGKLTADKSMYPIVPPPTDGDIPAPYAKAYNNNVAFYWGLDAYLGKREELDSQRRQMKPMLEGYTADLSEYDPNGQCDNSSMWLSINGHQAFLRQNIIPIDMEAIPDHQVKP